MRTNPTLPILATLAAVSLAGCKLLPTAESAGKGGAAAFDPDRMVAEVWSEKVLPYLERKAGSFAEVQSAAVADPAAAGEKFGNLKKQANSPWTFAVRLEGVIVSSNTQSRAATIDIDADGDGKPDARVQIGPALRGTALRDSLDFVNFNDFTNQIDFAQFGKAFNTHADRTVLSKLPREGLDGRIARVLGAYALTGAGELPLVTPATAEIGPKP